MLRRVRFLRLHFHVFVTRRRRVLCGGCAADLLCSVVPVLLCRPTNHSLADLGPRVFKLLMQLLEYAFLFRTPWPLLDGWIKNVNPTSAALFCITPFHFGCNLFQSTVGPASCSRIRRNIFWSSTGVQSLRWRVFPPDSMVALKGGSGVGEPERRPARGSTASPANPH